ncbi:MAG: GCN5-related N-acetyltransferase [Gammaproteobacteria bacterium]|nr:GCN5-related N-acetyltransferase [Gammaproteobacteria bacterium]
MNSGQRLAIVYSIATGSSVARYVTRGFFSLREFPQAFARMVLTGEFGLFVGIPLVLLVAARLFQHLLPRADTLATVLTIIAVLWLIIGLVRISRYGRSSGIGCYALETDGSLGQLAGGLRMRLERPSRKLWIAGLLVEPEWRGAGIGTALILAAFRLAWQQAAHGTVTVCVFAPSHPASKAIIEKQLGGLQTIAVTVQPSEMQKRTMDRLEQALSKSQSTFDWRLTDTEQPIF